MKKVLVFGTFDCIHEGHLSFIRQSKRHGSFVVAVVARDSNVKRAKGRGPVQKEETRARNLRRHVDRVYLGERKISYSLIKKIDPDVICIGYDQRPSIEESKKILREIGMEGVSLKKMKAYRPSVYKSSRFR